MEKVSNINLQQREKAENAARINFLSPCGGFPSSLEVQRCTGSTQTVAAVVLVGEKVT